MKAQQTPAAFKALSDPIRLEILDRIAAGSEVTATQLAAVLRITRQAVARHIKMLENAGLVIGVRTGREHRYQLETMPLVKAVTWLQARTASWDRALERLAEHLQGD